MTEMSRRFNFDDFDQQIADALAEHERLSQDAQMAEEDEAWEQYERWLEHDTDKQPGEVGAVVTRLSFRPEINLPPDAA